MPHKTHFSHVTCNITLIHLDTFKNTFFDELGEIVGLENIFNDVEGWSVVSEEEVINRNKIDEESYKGKYLVSKSIYFKSTCNFEIKTRCWIQEM